VVGWQDVLANANQSHYYLRMIICVCHRVSDRDIAREVRGGCCSFETLQDDLRVGTACGACADCAREVFHAASGAAGGCGGSRCAGQGGAAPAGAAR
jgi:bacterioferritin-associated ferredoxin